MLNFTPQDKFLATPLARTYVRLSYVLFCLVYKGSVFWSVVVFCVFLKNLFSTKHKVTKNHIG